MWFSSQQELFFFTELSILTWPTQPPPQWVPETISTGIMQLGHDADHFVDLMLVFRIS
jgi:hypothetical protein